MQRNRTAFHSDNEASRQNGKIHFCAHFCRCFVMNADEESKMTTNQISARKYNKCTAAAALRAIVVSTDKVVGIVVEFLLLLAIGSILCKWNFE